LGDSRFTAAQAGFRRALAISALAAGARTEQGIVARRCEALAARCADCPLAFLGPFGAGACGMGLLSARLTTVNVLARRPSPFVMDGTATPLAWSRRFALDWCALRTNGYEPSM
jgi:hypothetical protein